MVLGLGMDIVEVARIQRILAGPPARAERFLARCFTPAERAYCDAARDVRDAVRGPLRGEGGRVQGARRARRDRIDTTSRWCAARARRRSSSPGSRRTRRRGSACGARSLMLTHDGGLRGRGGRARGGGEGDEARRLRRRCARSIAPRLSPSGSVVGAHGPRRPRRRGGSARRSRRRAAGLSSFAAAGTTAETATSPRACCAPGVVTRASCRSSPRRGLGGTRARSREEAERAGVPVDEAGELGGLDAGPGDVVVDAIFGTGLSRAPEGAFARAIERIYAARDGGRARPRGRRPVRPLRRHRPAARRGVRPGGSHGHLRVPEARPRPPPRRRPSRARWAWRTSASPPRPPSACQSGASSSTAAAARVLLPPRPPDAHKGDAGRLLVVAGSPGKTGAAPPRAHGGAARRRGPDARRPAEALPFALSGSREAISVALARIGCSAGGPPRRSLPRRRGDALVDRSGHPRGPETGEPLCALPRGRGRRRRSTRTG